MVEKQISKPRKGRKGKGITEYGGGTNESNGTGGKRSKEKAEQWPGRALNFVARGIGLVREGREEGRKWKGREEKGKEMVLRARAGVKRECLVYGMSKVGRKGKTRKG